MLARRILFGVSIAALVVGAASLRAADVVPAEDAASHTGSAVTIEGDVLSATRTSDGVVLEIGTNGETYLRAVLVEALISNLPRDPDKVYGGKRVQVSGILQRFKGKLEMVCESTSQVAIIDLAGTTPTTLAAAPPATVPAAPRAATPPPPSAAAPAPSVPPVTAPEARPVEPTPPAPAPRAVAPAPPASTAAAPVTPTPAAPTGTPTPAPSAPAAPAVVQVPVPTPTTEVPARPLLTERLAAQACETARERWRAAAATARSASEALVRCLDGAAFHCRPEAAALAPALADLELAEQRVAERCD